MWTKVGNFNHTFNSGGLLNRQKIYTNTSPGSFIRELQVLGTAPVMSLFV